MTGMDVDVTRLQSSGSGWCMDRLRGVVGVRGVVGEGRRDLAVFGDTVTQKTDLCHTEDSFM